MEYVSQKTNAAERKDCFMNLFGKSEDKNEPDVLTDIELPDAKERISEMLVKRDSFFHSCWMILKTRRPDVWEDMTKIELYVSGYDDPTEKKEDDKKNESSPVVL